MDHRTALQPGYELHLGPTACRIGRCLGKGSNSIVYRASYEDASLPGQLHFVLIKELFPWRPEGGIYRSESGSVCVEPDAEKLFSIHQESFLRGNRVHLELQRARADKVPLNWNTYPANGTLYTVSGDSGGQTLSEVLRADPSLSLEAAATWMRSLLYSLRAFHSQGLLHLDISPDNILLQPLDEGKAESLREVLLIDYNSAWDQEELVRRGELFLSLKEPYTSPEARLRVMDSIGVPADLYSVCVVFLTCLSGIPPERENTGRRLHTLKDLQVMQGIPDTVLNQTISILRRGLKSSPRQRYQTANEMIGAFSELLARLEGGGVTHAAFWEASAEELRTARARIPAYAELEELFLSRRKSLSKFCAGGSCFLTGGGGTGKTSTLLNLWMEGTRTYHPDRPVPVYLPLYAYDGGKNYLRWTLLGMLHLAPGKKPEAADCALTRFLNGPEVNVRLLLDGVDEAAGDIRPPASGNQGIQPAARRENNCRGPAHDPGTSSLPILPKLFFLVVSCFVLAPEAVVPQRFPVILCCSFTFPALGLRMGFFDARMGFVWVSGIGSLTSPAASPAHTSAGYRCKKLEDRYPSPADISDCGPV